MIESEIRQLPVYSGEKLLGFITDEDIIREAVLENWGDIRVEEIMTKKPTVVEEDESVGRVINLFREYGISHLPVVSGSNLVGIISIHDILENIYRPLQRQTLGERTGEKIPSLNIPVGGIMTKPVITVLPGARLKDCAEKMHKFGVSSLVVTSKGRPVGILTKRDFLEPIVQIEEMRRRITIQFSVKNVGVDDIRRNFMIDEFESFTNRYKDTLGAGTLFVYLKAHGTNYKGDQLVHCRLQLRTRKGSFFSSSEGYGVEQIFTSALDKLDKQILRSKVLEYDPEYVKNYLNQIGFPSTEL
jgi:CBS domain-containing protein